MTEFQASLIAAGDPEPLPTTVALDRGKLLIESNGQPIGDWNLEDLEFERIVGGFRVKIDGEVAVLKLTHSDEFNAALREINEQKPEEKDSKKAERKEAKEAKRAKKAAKGRDSEPTPASAPTQVATPPAEAREEPRAAATEAPATSKPKTGEVSWLDQRLEKASKRWDRFVPDWVFTKGGLAVGAFLLIMVLIFRPVFSTLFLIIAAIGLITSAVSLLDQVIATRIFRGGFTPIHGLIGSLFLVLISLLLAAL